MRLGTDSDEYEILGRAAAAIDGVSGLCIELGLREGGGSQWMIENYKSRRTHIAIDPFGSLPYEWQQDTIAPWVYDNTMRNRAIADLMNLTNGSSTNFIFFNMTDAEYFKRFADGVPVFLGGKSYLEVQYALVHFDAVHSIEAIENQIDFFNDRVAQKARFVFDDVVGFYDHDRVQRKLQSLGWTAVEIGQKKASYVK